MIVRKRKLVANLVEDCKSECLITKDNKKFDKILDVFVDNVELVLSKRYLKPRYKLPKSDHWSAKILPNLDEDRFRTQLRVTREQFQTILSEIVHHPIFHSKTNQQMKVEQQLAIFLFRVGHNGNGASYRNIAQKFSISDGGTIRNITTRVLKAILSLRDKYIYWPDEDERCNLEEMISYEMSGCIGFLDGSHIPLREKPDMSFPETYFSRKQKYSLHLQIVADYNLKIRHYKVGKPGSVHDAKVFNNCAISLHPNEYFSSGEYLAGDAAYKLTMHCITPFRKNASHGTSVQRRKFNRHFSKYRVKVEHSFGILKEKFASLKELRVKICCTETHILACQWIEACCILYNMTLKDNDIQYFNLLTNSEILDQESPAYEADNLNGEERRLQLFNYIMLKPY